MAVTLIAADAFEIRLALHGVALRRGLRGEGRGTAEHQTRDDQCSRGNWHTHGQYRSSGLTRLGDDVDEHGLAHFHRFDAALEGGAELLGIGDRAGADMAQGFRELGVIDERLADRGGDTRGVGMTLGPMWRSL